MKKLISYLKGFFPLFLTFCALILILFEIPLFVIQSLIIFVYAFSIFMLLIQFIHKNEKIYLFPKTVVFFCVFNCFIAISSIRSFLVIEKMDNQLYIIRKLGLLICKDNFICGFFSTIIIVGVILYFTKLYILKRTEDKTQKSLDKLNLKIWEIRHNEIDGKITNTEADLQRESVNIDLGYYSSIVGAAKYLIGTIWAFIGLFIIVTVGGVSVGILEFNLSWHEALNQYIVLSVGYLIVFVIPLFIVCVSFSI